MYPIEYIGVIHQTKLLSHTTLTTQTGAVRRTLTLTQDSYTTHCVFTPTHTITSCHSKDQEEGRRRWTVINTQHFPESTRNEICPYLVSNMLTATTNRASTKNFEIFGRFVGNSGRSAELKLKRMKMEQLNSGTGNSVRTGMWGGRNVLSLSLHPYL